MKPGSTEGMRDYLEAVGKRFAEDADAYKRFAELKSIIVTAHHHLNRFDMAVRRLLLAERLSDPVARQYERDVMKILLYEALDHIYMAFSKLDLDGLGLRMCAAGNGLTGENAHEVLTILDLMEGLSAETLKREKCFCLKLDFSRSIPEKEGITYGLKSHWNAGDLREYFIQCSKLVNAGLHRKAGFWSGRTMADFLRQREYHQILAALVRLELLHSRGDASLRAA